MNKLFQTATSVHDEKQSDLSRRADHMREGAIMLGMTVFSQLLAFSALYMLPVAATSAWWGVLLLILGIVLIVRGLRTMKAEKAAGNAPEKKSTSEAVKGFWADNRAVVEMFVVLLVYIALIQPVGFLISTFLFLFAEFNILTYKEDRKLGFSIIFALVCAVGIYVMFKYGFKMPLPQGILKGIF